MEKQPSIKTLLEYDLIFLGEGVEYICYFTKEHPNIVIMEMKMDGMPSGFFESYILANEEMYLNNFIDLSKRFENASRAGIRCPQHLEIYIDRVNKRVFHSCTRMVGKNILSDIKLGDNEIIGYEEQQEKINVLLNAPQEHFDYYAKSIKRLTELGFLLEIHSGNVLYNPEVGCSFIDIKCYNYNASEMITKGLNFFEVNKAKIVLYFANLLRVNQSEKEAIQIGGLDEIYEQKRMIFLRFVQGFVNQGVNIQDIIDGIKNKEYQHWHNVDDGLSFLNNDDFFNRIKEIKVILLNSSSLRVK